MAIENMGGIEFTVDADTAPLIDSEKALGKSVDKMEVKLLKLDKVTAKYTATLKKSGNQVSKTGLVVDKYGKVNEHATNRLKNLTAQQMKLSQSAVGVREALKKSNKQMAGMSRGAGQAGIQLQQFIGQVQGGQSAMLAFSQQAADVGIVLGAPMVGAILGISASLIGMMIPSLMNSKTTLEELEKATENVKAAMTLGVDGIISYSDEMKKLNNISEMTLRIKLGNLVTEQANAIKIAQKGIAKSLDETRGSFDTYSDLVKKVYKEYTPKTVAAMRDLAKSLRKLKTDTTPESFEALSVSLQKSTDAGIRTTKSGLALSNQIIDLVAAYKNGEKTIDGINLLLKKNKINLDEDTDSAGDNKDAVDALVKSLKMQAEAIGKKDRAIAISLAKSKNATKEQLKAINAAFDTIEAEEKRIKSIGELDRAMEQSFQNELKRVKAEKKAKADAQSEIDRIMEAEFQKEQAREGAEKKKQQKAFTVTTSIVSRGDTLEDKLQKERDLLTQYREDGLISAKLYQEGLTQLDKEGAEARGAINRMAIGSLSNSFGQVAEMLKNSGDEQSSAYKAMFALSKGFAVAQAGLNLALAISNASAISPWYASLPAVASVVSSGAAFAGSIANATYSGRENGGGVNKGQTYEVGEKNKPEMLMIPGNNGKVFSNAEMKSAMGGGGGGGGVVVNLFGAPQGTSVESRQDPVTLKQVVDVVIGQMSNPNSEGMRGMRSVTDVNNRLSSNRRT